VDSGRPILEVILEPRVEDLGGLPEQVDLDTRVLLLESRLHRLGSALLVVRRPPRHASLFLSGGVQPGDVFLDRLARSLTGRAAASFQEFAQPAPHRPAKCAWRAEEADETRPPTPPFQSARFPPGGPPGGWGGPGPCPPAAPHQGEGGGEAPPRLPSPPSRPRGGPTSRSLL